MSSKHAATLRDLHDDAAHRAKHASTAEHRAMYQQRADALSAGLGAVTHADLETRWQAFAAAMALNMEEPSAELKARGVTTRYKYAHTSALWQAFALAMGAPQESDQP